MGLEHDRVRDQLAGQLAGAVGELEVSERALVEAVARRDEAAASVQELRAILEVHRKAAS